MEVLFPHRVEYLVDGPVPIDEVIGTLEAQKKLIGEVGEIIERLIDGLRVEKAELRVSQISSGSLKEAFFVALFLAYQTELQAEIPPMVEHWLGLPVDQRYDTLVTVAVVLLLFYGADYAYKRLTDQLGSERIKKRLDDVVCELAHLSGKSEAQVRTILESHLSRKARLKEVAKASIKFFRSSRNQRNAPILIGNRRVESVDVAEVPNQVELTALDAEDTSVPIYGTRIEIRAKDHDHDGSGWGGIVHSVSSERKPVRLYPNVSKDFLWNNDDVWADVMVTYRTTPTGPKPIRYHIMQTYDGPRRVTY